MNSRRKVRCLLAPLACNNSFRGLTPFLSQGTSSTAGPVHVFHVRRDAHHELDILCKCCPTTCLLSLQAHWSVAIAKATVIIFLGAILLADVMFLEESSFVFDPDYKVSPAALPHLPARPSLPRTYAPLTSLQP